METLSLSCNHCGATLDIPGETRFVTCTSCDTKLEIRRKGGAAFTKVKEAVERLERHAERADARGKQLERDLKVVQIEQQIYRLETEWERDKSDLMNQNGSRPPSVPTKMGAWARFVAVAALGVITWWISPPNFGLYIGLAYAFAGVVAALWQADKADRYERALGVYTERHSKLSGGLREARGEAEA